MGLFKEEMVEAESLSKRQIRIYPDACDTGIPICRGRNTGERDRCRRLLQTLLADGLLEQDNSWGVEAVGGRAWQFFIAIERDAGRLSGIVIRIAHHKDRRNRGGCSVEWLSVEVYRDTRKE